MKTRFILLALCVLAYSSMRAVASPAELISKGDKLAEQGKSREARAAFLEAELASPADAEVLHRLAKVSAEMMVDTDSKPGRKEVGLQAVDYAERAVAADARNARAHLALAICCGRVASLLDNRTKIEYSKRVREHAMKAIAIDPSLDYAYHVLGAWNFELATLNPVLRALAKVTYGELSAASLDDAVFNLKKAISLAPQRVAHHVELGRTYAAMGKSEEARAELNQGLSLPNREKDDADTKERARQALRKL